MYESVCVTFKIDNCILFNIETFVTIIFERNKTKIKSVKFNVFE